MSNKTTFAQLIIDKIGSAIGNDGSSFSSDSPLKVQQAIADAVTEFVTTYVWCKSAYNGNMLTTPFPKDPVVSDDHQVTGTCAPASIPTSDPNTALSSWLSDLSSKICSSFVVLPGNLGLTYAAPLYPFQGTIKVTTADLKPIHEANQEDPQLAVMEVIAQGIIDMLTSQANSMTMVATIPGQSAGTGNLVANYIMSTSSGAAMRGGGGRSEESYIRYDYLDWDSGTWDDYYWWESEDIDSVNSEEFIDFDVDTYDDTLWN